MKTLRQHNELRAQIALLSKNHRPVDVVFAIPERNGSLRLEASDELIGIAGYHLGTLAGWNTASDSKLQGLLKSIALGEAQLAKELKELKAMQDEQFREKLEEGRKEIAEDHPRPQDREAVMETFHDHTLDGLVVRQEADRKTCIEQFRSEWKVD